MNELKPSVISSRHVWVGTLALFVAALMLVLHIDDLSLWADEAFTVHFIENKPDQMLINRELSWPVGYYMLLKGWRGIAGREEFILRVFGVFCGMFGSAFIFQAGRRLGTMSTGFFAALLFATSGYAAYFLLELRGYTLMLALIALAVWLHLRWMARPSWRRLIPAALAVIALAYVQYAGILILILLGGHVLLSRPRKLLQWLPLPFVVTIAYIPVWPAFIASTQVRDEVMAGGPPGYLTGGPFKAVTFYSRQPLLFVGLLLLVMLGLTFLLRRKRSRWGDVLWLAGWGVAVPALAYLVQSLGMYSARYLTFTMIGLFLLLAVGLSALPRRVLWLGAGLIVVLATVAWQPYAYRPNITDEPNVREFILEMRDRIGPGEVFVIDPGTSAGIDLTWWWYETVYWPGGRAMPHVSDPSDTNGGVWYVYRQGSEDPQLRDTAADGRRYTEFFGPWYFIAEHYEAPPLADGYIVGDRMRFHGSRVLPRDFAQPGDNLTVQSWWAVDAVLERDYSFGLFLYDPDGNLVAQVDSGPTGSFTPEQTSAWQPGQFYRDDRTITIPYKVSMGDYTLRLVTYYWEDGIPLTIDEDAPQQDGGLLLGSIFVDTWSGYELMN